MYTWMKDPFSGLFSLENKLPPWIRLKKKSNKKTEVYVYLLTSIRVDTLRRRNHIHTQNKLIN